MIKLRLRTIKKFAKEQPNTNFWHKYQIKSSSYRSNTFSTILFFSSQYHLFLLLILSHLDEKVQELNIVSVYLFYTESYSDGYLNQL